MAVQLPQGKRDAVLAKGAIPGEGVVIFVSTSVPSRSRIAAGSSPGTGGSFGR